VELKRGDYVGEFNLGSTIVLIFEAPEGFAFGPLVGPGSRVLVGKALTADAAEIAAAEGREPVVQELTTVALLASAAVAT
jgi:Phosphatidylserine decarboxylase